jgi:hypothetical protein
MPNILDIDTYTGVQFVPLHRRDLPGVKVSTGSAFPELAHFLLEQFREGGNQQVESGDTGRLLANLSAVTSAGFDQCVGGYISTDASYFHQDRNKKRLPLVQSAKIAFLCNTDPPLLAKGSVVRPVDYRMSLYPNFQLHEATDSCKVHQGPPGQLVKYSQSSLTRQVYHAAASFVPKPADRKDTERVLIRWQ